MSSNELFAEKLNLLKQYDQDGNLGREMMELAIWLFEEAKGDVGRNEAIQTVAQLLSKSQNNFRVGLILYGINPRSLPTKREIEDEWNSEDRTIVKKSDGSVVVVE